VNASGHSLVQDHDSMRVVRLNTDLSLYFSSFVAAPPRRSLRLSASWTTNDDSSVDFDRSAMSPDPSPSARSEDPSPP